MSQFSNNTTIPEKRKFKNYLTLFMMGDYETGCYFESISKKISYNHIDQYSYFMFYIRSANQDIVPGKRFVSTAYGYPELYNFVIRAERHIEMLRQYFLENKKHPNDVSLYNVVSKCGENFNNKETRLEFSFDTNTNEIVASISVFEPSYSMPLIISSKAPIQKMSGYISYLSNVLKNWVLLQTSNTFFMSQIDGYEVNTSNENKPQNMTINEDHNISLINNDNGSKCSNEGDMPPWATDETGVHNQVENLNSFENNQQIAGMDLNGFQDTNLNIDYGAIDINQPNQPDKNGNQSVDPGSFF